MICGSMICGSLICGSMHENFRLEIPACAGKVKQQPDSDQKKGKIPASNNQNISSQYQHSKAGKAAAHDNNPFRKIFTFQP
jgi:hypothetical protein